MRHDEVFLQLREVVMSDGDVAKRAESCGYAVDGFLTFGHLAVEIVAAFRYAPACVVAQGKTHFFIKYFADAGQSQAFG